MPPNRDPHAPERQDHGLWATLAKTHAAGAMLPRHQHGRGQLVFGTSGVMLVETANVQWTVPPQRALWIPHRQPHTVRTLSSTDMRTVYFQPALIARCLPAQRLDQVHAVAASPLIRELVLGLFDAQFDHATHEAMAGLLLRTLRHAPALPISLPMPADARLHRALALLLQAQAWHWPIERLAQEAAMSERSFTRHFTGDMGMSFRAWRQRARVIASLDLLNAGRPVKAVARQLQFASDAAYVAAFRDLLGCTPSAFRSQTQEVEASKAPARS
ncbi:helix-turn-helix transcriptional regulator [Ramlibacter sp.]|uniref:AraC family transcriptional regulator n=1 Tax=Ramlibacter sp. TaxID=1917967 RepID=UPI001854BFA3|nr:helix-turn-helix transcriptional regulator [Ramlibacter sp.]MBA2672672.1 helix-turn-helix transcriptional regulator [Ramlibacter sp.]